MITQLTFSKEKIADFCRRHYISRLAVFGSAIRDDFHQDSDLDILVEFEPHHTPGSAFFAMEAELSRILERRVDLNTENFLSKRFREQAVGEAKAIYEKA